VSLASTDTDARESKEPRGHEDGIRWDGRVHSYRPRPDWKDRVSSKVIFHTEATPDLDPVTFEVIRNRLWSTNLAHGETLTRISGSPVFQALDFNMCVLSEDAEVVMNGPFITYLNVGAPLAIRFILENLSEAPGIEEGDVFLASDPWVGASHQMDVLVTAPVFHDGQLFAWVANAGHQIDMGGIVPGGWPQNAPDIYSDPTFFTPFKIVERGVLRTDLERMYRRQSRFPDLLALDLRAQLSGCRFAVEAIHEMTIAFGAATLKAAMRRILDNSQQSFVEKLRRIPDGTWSEVRYIDEKMPGDRSTYRVQVNVTKHGDRLTIDNDGTDPQQDGPIGFNFASFYGAVLGTLSVTMLTEHLFSLGGANRQVDLRLTPGTLSCVDYPAPVSGGVVSIINCINSLMLSFGRMLSCDPELKEDVIGGQSDWPILLLVGANDRGGKIGTALMEGAAMGSGSRHGHDGTDTGGLSWSPLMRVLNAEAVEQYFPVMYIYRRERCDSGGAGRWRGGAGMEVALTPYRATHIEVVSNVGGQAFSTNGVNGMFGGYPVPTSSFEVFRGTDLAETFAGQRMPAEVDELTCEDNWRLRGKSNGTPLNPGDVIVCTFGAGSGFGDPLERPTNAVASDVALGYVSAESAAKLFGVVLGDDGQPQTEPTRRRREELLGERRSWPRVPDVLDAANRPAFTPAQGEPPLQVHEYVVARDEAARRVLACVRCDTVLGDYAADYRRGLCVDRGPLTLIPQVQDPAFFIDSLMELRRYCCPGCQVLMSADVVKAEEPLIPEMLLSPPTDRPREN
jgi:N-methylhydantoinase B